MPFGKNNLPETVNHITYNGYFCICVFFWPFFATLPLHQREEAFRFF